MDLDDIKINSVIELLKKKEEENPKPQKFEPKPFAEIFGYESEIKKNYPECRFKLIQTKLKTKSGNNKCIWYVYDRENENHKVAVHKAIQFKNARGTSVAIFREPSKDMNPWESNQD